MLESIEYAEIAAKLEANHGFLQQNFEAWEASHGALETNHRSLQQNCEALLHAQQDGVVVEGGISKSGKLLPLSPFPLSLSPQIPYPRPKSFR